VIGNITQSIPKDLVSGATTMPAAIVTQLPEASLPAQRTALVMVAFLLLVITFVLIVIVRQVTTRQPRARARRAAPAVAQATVKAGTA
jgi:ABC-type phosphate transport system permease subunit